MALPDPSKTAYWSDYFTFMIPDQGYRDIDQSETFISSTTPEEHTLGTVSGDLTTIDSMICMFMTFNRDHDDIIYTPVPTVYSTLVNNPGPTVVTMTFSYAVEPNGNVVLKIVRGGIAPGSYTLSSNPERFRIVVYGFNLVAWS